MHFIARRKGAPVLCSQKAGESFSKVKILQIRCPGRDTHLLTHTLKQCKLNYQPGKSSPKKKGNQPEMPEKSSICVSLP